MTTTTYEGPATPAPVPTTRHRKTLDETLAALSLERKVEIIKDLKMQVGEELAKTQKAAATAAEMAKDL